MTVVVVRSTGRRTVHASLHPTTGRLLVYAPLRLSDSGVLAQAAGQLDADMFAELVDALGGPSRRETANAR